MDILADVANPFWGANANARGVRFDGLGGARAGYGGNVLPIRRARRDLRRFSKLKSGMSSYGLKSRFGNYLGAKIFGGKNYYADNGYSFGDVAKKFVPGILGQGLLNGALGLASGIGELYLNNMFSNTVSQLYDDEHGMDDVRSGVSYAISKGYYKPSGGMWPSGHRENFKQLGRAIRKHKTEKAQWQRFFVSRAKKARLPNKIAPRMRRGFGARPVSFFKSATIREGPFLR